MKETEKAFREKSKDVAKALGPNWELSFTWRNQGGGEYQRGGYDLINRQDFLAQGTPTVAVIHLALEYGDEGRASARGNFPHYKTADGRTQEEDPRKWIKGERENWPCIGFSASKTPEQIASDIRRRLLPVYLPMLARAAVAARDTDAKLEGARHLADQLAEILGTEVRIDRDGFNLYGALDFEVSSYGGVAVKGRPSQELALALAKVAALAKAAAEMHQKEAEGENE